MGRSHRANPEHAGVGLRGLAGPEDKGRRGVLIRDTAPDLPESSGSRLEREPSRRAAGLRPPERFSFEMKEKPRKIAQNPACGVALFQNDSAGFIPPPKAGGSPGHALAQCDRI